MYLANKYDSDNARCEMIIDFRTKQLIKAPILIDSHPITITKSFKFQGAETLPTQNQAGSTGPILHSQNPENPVTGCLAANSPNRTLYTHTTNHLMSNQDPG